MATINTNDLRISNAKNFASSLGQGSYVFVGRQQPWDSDVEPPTPINNYDTFISTYNQMVSMNAISGTDVFHLISRLNWTSGVVYDIYRHDYSTSNKSYSGVSNLINANWVVLSSNNAVYACLGNNKNGATTVEPQNTGSEPFYTSDGYQWLFLYQLTSDQLFNYSTDKYIPIIDSDSVTTSAGEIYSVVIDTPGANYTGSPSGVSTQIPYYYCNILGDGSGAVAQVSVANGEVTDIKVVRSGSGYTYAFLDFVVGRAYKSLGDLDSDINGLDPLGDGTFRSTVIIPPPLGFGNDLVSELGGVNVGIFSSLSYDLYDFVSDMSFRQVGVIQNPVLNSGTTSSVTACYAMAVSTYGGAESYTIGEEITQDLSAVLPDDGGDRIARGTVVGYDSDNNVVRYVQDPKYNSDPTGHLYRFSGTSYVVGTVSGKITSPNTTFSGNLSDVAFVGGYADPEVVKYTGSLSYLTNISPVLRQPAQTERIRLIVTY